MVVYVRIYRKGRRLFIIGDKKVHLYERSNYPEHSTSPTRFSRCFHDCRGLTDYAQIPFGWR